MKKKLPQVPMYSRLCCECPAKFFDPAMEGLTEKVIKHFQKNHPLKPESCYDLVRKTWLPGYDASITAFLNTKARLNEIESTLQQTEDSRKTLVTKLNSIIMILREGPR